MIFGDLQYDDADEAWTGSVPLRLFAAFFGATRSDGDPEEQERRRAGLLPLVIRDPSGEGPSHAQEVAYRHLRDTEADVFRAALDALFESYKEYTASSLSAVWGWVGRLLGVKPIESPEALDACFTGVEITREHTGGVAYVLFDVSCDWEPEHGMMVVYHKDRPATWTTPEALELESDT